MQSPSHQLILALALALASATGMPCHAGNPKPDAFAKFYLASRERCGEAKDKQERLKILDAVRLQAEQGEDSPWYGGALVWLGQEYMANGHPERAVEVLEKASKLGGRMAGAARMELGRAQRMAGSAKASEATLRKTMEDEALPARTRMAAAEELRILLTTKKDHRAAAAQAKLQLEKGWGNRKILYQAIADEACEAKQFALALEYLEKMLKDASVQLSREERLLAGKQALRCQYKGEVRRLGYLEGMSNLLDSYEGTATGPDDVSYPRLIAERTALGNSYHTIDRAYELSYLEPLPLSADEARSRCLGCFLQAVDCFRRATREGAKLPGATTDQVKEAYAMAIKLCASMGAEAQAAALTQEAAKAFPDNAR